MPEAPGQGRGDDGDAGGESVTLAEEKVKEPADVDEVAVLERIAAIVRKAAS